MTQDKINIINFIGGVIALSLLLITLFLTGCAAAGATPLVTYTNSQGEKRTCGGWDNRQLVGGVLGFEAAKSESQRCAAQAKADGFKQ